MTAQMLTERNRPARIRRMRAGEVRAAVMAAPLSSGIAENDVQEFLQAMERFKQRADKLFPSWSEVLDVLRSLGYKKTDT